MKKLITLIEQHPILSILLITLPMLLINLGSFPITIMEARDFITAREMLHDNHWLLTTMNGVARYEKPPLPTWLSAISAFILGQSGLFAWRLPGALMVIFIGIYIYFFSLKLRLTRNQALQNALISTTSFYIIAITIEAPWDIFAHGFMLAGIYYLYKFFQEKENIWTNTLLSSIFIGFSILSKGPVSLYALLLPFIISYFIVYKWVNKKEKIIPLLSLILLSIMIGSWWWIYVYLNDTSSTSIFSKETNNWTSYNVKPFYYYWYFFVQSGIWTIPAFMSLLYPYMIRKTAHKKAYKFTFLWTIISVILLSLIPEKKMRYLMPVLIPLSLNLGFYIEYFIQYFKKIKNKYELIPPYLNTILLILVSFLIPIILLIKFNPFSLGYPLLYILISISFFIMGFILIKSLLKKDFKEIFYSMVFITALAFILIMPLKNILNKNNSAKEIAKIQTIEKEQHIKTYSLGKVAPEFLWYYNGKIKDLYKNKTLRIPDETTFGIVISLGENKSPYKIFGSKYEIKEINEYNLNPGKKQRQRLIHKFYIIKKK